MKTPECVVDTSEIVAMFREHGGYMLVKEILETGKHLAIEHRLARTLKYSDNAYNRMLQAHIDVLSQMLPPIDKGGHVETSRRDILS